MRTYSTSCRTWTTSTMQIRSKWICSYGYFAFDLSSNVCSRSVNWYQLKMQLFYLQCRYAWSGYDFLVFENVTCGEHCRRLFISNPKKSHTIITTLPAALDNNNNNKMITIVALNDDSSNYGDCPSIWNCSRCNSVASLLTICDDWFCLQFFMLLRVNTFAAMSFRATMS